MLLSGALQHAGADINAQIFPLLDDIRQAIKDQACPTSNINNLVTIFYSFAQLPPGKMRLGEIDGAIETVVII